MILTLAGAVTLVALAVAFALNLHRLLVGPETVDRVLALDTMTINAVAAVVTTGVMLATPLYFEAALLLAMVGFVGTVAFCKYLMRGSVIE
jgi:multicomponent K+:H+ antiporter subunit F